MNSYAKIIIFFIFLSPSPSLSPILYFFFSADIMMEYDLSLFARKRTEKKWEKKIRKNGKYFQKDCNRRNVEGKFMNYKAQEIVKKSYYKDHHK